MVNSKILVTGCSGFLGEALCRELLKKEEVTGIDIINPPEDLDISFIKHDIRNRLPKYKFDIIFHCAALVPIARASWRDYYLTNALGTYHVLNIDFKKFIHISSSAIYGSPDRILTEQSKENPIEIYGESKAFAEILCKHYRQFNPSVSIVRPRTIIGNKRVGMMDLLFSRVMKNKTIPLIGDGSNRFQLLSLEDCIDALLKIYHSDLVNEDYNLGTDKFTTLGNDISAFINRVDSKSKIKYLPKSFKWVLRILDKLNMSPMTSWHYETTDRDFYFDMSKANKELNWYPKDSNVDMLIKSYNWYKDNISDKYTTLHKSKLKKKLLNWI